MSHLTTPIRALTARSHRDEEGAGMVEYALLIVFVAVLAIIGLEVLGDGLGGIFENIGDGVSEQNLGELTPSGG